MWEFLLEYMIQFSHARFIDKQNIYTYAQIISIVKKHKDELSSQIPPGSKCGILCDKNMNTAIAILSCWCAELIPVPMSMNYGKLHCQSILDLTMPDIIIVDNNTSYTSVAVYDIGKGRFINDVMSTRRIEAELYDVVLLMCTSGTTGTPKGAMILADGLKQNILSIADYFHINNKDTIIIARPLYHCAVLTGEFLVSLYKGLDIVFFDISYNPVLLLELAYQTKATVLCGTPTMFNHISLLIKKHPKMLCIRKIALSGECLTREIAHDIRAVFFNAEIYNVYGLTEASPRVSYLPPEHFDKYPESVGVPLNGIKIKIVDLESKIKKSDDSPGLVFVKSPSLMKGYYNNTKSTDLICINGWLNTGDIGYKDKNGFLYILARADDMIIKAGMNIYPKEIENAINALPEIIECVAYGIKSESGENIAIDVVLNNSIMDVKTLMLKLQSVLPSYLLPTKVNVVKSVPKNASGKIVRHKDKRI